MEITMSRVSLSLAVLIAIVCCADAMRHKRSEKNYIAFPRMGRSGYLAFPRMGRGGAKADGEAGCCGIGLKDEFVVGHDGKEELRTLCGGRSECCEGLREIVDEKPDGVYYSMCVPDIPVSGQANSRSSQVLNKLKTLLKK
ncbi:hypothetical protein PoB_004849100 [Plakobranchus ocellatus]|uniref:Small cardioactive peptide n=1 Tax=Plakobranchus ocellatus TaxID=259542 RepID=A0AAV4BFA0_9GAST|nr:hypothetical protein PoB_004849100 [Plakobranchus ocellatus]